MRHSRTLLAAALLVFGLTTSGCSTFDPTEWFSTKKPLPGDRKAVFPEGVPGVPQGVPAELVEGYREPVPEPLPIPEQKAKPKPRPAPAVKPVAAKPPAQPRAAAAPPAAPPAQGGQSAWPEAPPAPGRPAPAQSGSVFPDPPKR
ncbi:MAG: hypothetical protein NTV56_20755 [Alphaproteobacteria bacterium]|nr:hypothetical protein [Alphaproteobacteria bacterium]